MQRVERSWVVVAVLGAASACAPVSSGGPDAGGTYAFESRFVAGASSVAYPEQALRHVLVEAIEGRVEATSEKIDADGYVPAKGEVVSDLDFYFSYAKAGATGVEVPLETTPPVLQSTFPDFAVDADLKGAVAGNASEGLHADFKTAFVGWTGVTSPDALVRDTFELFEAAAIARANGDVPQGPDGKPVPSAYVTADGLHVAELLGKLLGGATTYSHATDVALDDATPGSGLLSDNTVAVAGQPYTALEHAWDVGFGSFGLPRNAADFTAEELAGRAGRDAFKDGCNDADGDVRIDLGAEYAFDPARYAAKRDLDSANAAKTEFLVTAWRHFLDGRTLITGAGGALTDAQLSTLKGHRDAIVSAWEKTIVASAIHYLNGVLAQMKAAGTASYAFESHAGEWTEMKGMLLTLQFNPRMALTAEQFASIHTSIGTRPVLPGQDGFEAYAATLRTVRATLGTTYGFDSANLGDDDGAGGW